MPEQDQSSRDIKTSDDYITRLLKLLPAEITGAYLAIRLVCSPEGNSRNSWIALFAALIFVIAPFFMYFVLQMRQLRQILFLTITYVVWIANFEIDRITQENQAVIDAANNLGGERFVGVAKFLIDPTFIKGIAILWLLLLSPLVFAKGTLAAVSPPKVDPPQVEPPKVDPPKGPGE